MIFLLFLIVQQEMRVEKVVFYGNYNVSSRELRKLTSTTKGKPYKEFQAIMDKSRVVAFYKARGYKDARIARWENEINKEKNSVKCKIYIEEGIRTYIKEIKIEGNKLFTEAQLIKATRLRLNTPFDEGAIFTAKCNIANFYAEQGYPYTEVTDSIFYSSLYEFSVCFYIFESHLVRFGDIRLEGHEGLRSIIAEREIVFKKGDIYSPKKVYESQARIYGTDLFKSVKFEIPDIDKRKDTLDIVFILRKEKPKWVAFGGGYVFPDHAWFNTGWGHSNLWGNAQKIEIQLNYEVNLFDPKAPRGMKITASYLEPYFLNTAFKAQAQPFYNFKKVEYEDSTYKLNSFGVQGKVGRYIGKFCQSFVGYNYKIVNSSGDIPSQEGFANSLLLSVDWDSRTDVFYPRRGALSFLSLESGGRFLGGDYEFNKVVFDFTIYSPFFFTTVATRVKFGAISGEPPLESKFFLGGINTIRGFSDMVYQPEWKEWMGIMNMELRVPLFKSFELSYFTDMGNVWSRKEDIKIGNLKLGAGMGIRYRTPIVPIRFDYGYGLVPAGQGNIYFTIGYMF